MKIFGREPALWMGIIQGVIALLIASDVVDWTQEQTTWLLAAIAAGFAVLTAWMTGETWMSLLVGFAGAVVACVLGFGVEMSPDLQASIVGLVAVFAAFYTRTQTSPADTPLSYNTRAAVHG